MIFPIWDFPTAFMLPFCRALEKRRIAPIFPPPMKCSHQWCRGVCGYQWLDIGINMFDQPRFKRGSFGQRREDYNMLGVSRNGIDSGTYYGRFKNCHFKWRLNRMGPQKQKTMRFATGIFRGPPWVSEDSPRVFRWWNSHPPSKDGDFSMVSFATNRRGPNSWPFS